MGGKTHIPGISSSKGKKVAEGRNSYRDLRDQQGSRLSD